MGKRRAWTDKFLLIFVGNKYINWHFGVTVLKGVVAFYLMIFFNNVVVVLQVPQSQDVCILLELGKGC